MEAKMKGAEAIIKTLCKQGTNVTFGFPGGAVIPLFDKYLDYSDKINNILVRHEQCAAHAAEGYARASGKVGVCIATSGPGATNLVTGIMDAYMDSVPLIAFGGQVPTGLIGNDAFQETDMMGITLPITKHNFQIRDPNEIESIITKAYKLALEGRPGPIYIDLPKDIQVKEITKNKNEVKIRGFSPTVEPNTAQISRAADMMMKAEMPLILAGGGVIASNASKELKQLAEFTGIPVVTTMMGKSCFDENHPLSLGTVGMHGRKIANYATLQTDLMIAIGCRFSDRITGNLESYLEFAKLIHIDIDPAEIGKNVKADLPVVGDARRTLSSLVVALRNKKWKEKKEWKENMTVLGKKCDKCIELKAGKKIFPKEIVTEVNKLLKKGDIITTGVGQHQMFAMHYLRMGSPRTFISSGGAGTMGFGLPAAIGAKVAKPNNNVFCFDGDGSFQMTIQELETIRSHNLKIVPIIFNNSFLGMVRQWLELFHDKRYSQVHLGNEIDFVKIAKAYHLDGITVERQSELPDAVKQSINADKTMVVDVKIEEESNVLPMLPPGGHLKEAFGVCMKSPGKFV
ncbi:biosynthetic-type acetolactate synthase large subunit [Candidatus Woesearchaeota archaeon]|nr:biosynthetic-type acetolactate synthase large subunit [Candidatus Woesearchaeota archaeon]